MVYNSQAFACVCPVCANSTFLQVQTLCRRRCFYGDSNCAQCFPSNAEVFAQVEGSVIVRSMKELSVGDVVLTQEGFSKIFAFMDHTTDVEAEYIRLETESGHVLSLTQDHILFAHEDRSPVLARSIVEGDIVWIALAANTSVDFAPSRVTKMGYISAHGMHAPLTEKGSVVVNGLLASSYASVKSLSWGHRILVSGHSLNKYMHEPLRLACSVKPTLCSPEWHSPNGRHAWTQFILDKFWWLQVMNYDHSDLKAALLQEPSAFSWLSAAVQLIAAALLSMTFGRLQPLMSCTVLALAGARYQAKKQLN